MKRCPIPLIARFLLPPLPLFPPFEHTIPSSPVLQSSGSGSPSTADTTQSYPNWQDDHLKWFASQLGAGHPECLSQCPWDNWWPSWLRDFLFLNKEEPIWFFSLYNTIHPVNDTSCCRMQFLVKHILDQNDVQKYSSAPWVTTSMTCECRQQPNTRAFWVR